MEEVKQTAPEVKKPTEDERPEWAKVLLEQNKALRDEIEMLKDIEGKNAIQSWKDKTKDYTKKFAKLKRFNDKVVVGWGKLDYSEYNAKAKRAVDENIKMELEYLGGKKEKVNYANFTNGIEFEVVDLVNPIKPGDTTVKINLRPETVKECNLESSVMDIDIKFLNP